MQAGENAMSELALGTGGRFFHNNNDLLGGLASLAAVPENLYLVEISLKDVKSNGAFHRLQLKLDKPGLEVLARKGYVAPKEATAKNGKPSDSHNRHRQACGELWLKTDADSRPAPNMLNPALSS